MPPQYKIRKFYYSLGTHYTCLCNFPLAPVNSEAANLWLSQVLWAAWELASPCFLLVVGRVTCMNRWVRAICRNLYQSEPYCVTGKIASLGKSSRSYLFGRGLTLKSFCPKADASLKVLCGSDRKRQAWGPPTRPRRDCSACCQPSSLSVARFPLGKVTIFELKM